MAPLMRLPGYQANALLDFSPVQGVLDRVDQRNERDRRYGLEQQQMGMQQERLGMDRQRFDQDRENQVKQRIGNLALLTLQEADETKRAENWQKVLALNPDAAKLGPQYADHRTGPLSLLADAGMAQNYLDWKMKQQQMRMQQAQEQRAAAGQARQDRIADAQLGQLRMQSPDARAEAAKRYGIQPDTPEYKSFVLQGSLPAQSAPSATVQKEIIEADEQAQAGRSVIESLDQAKKLSAKAYSGVGAGTRGSVVDAVVPWQTPEATNTVRLQQIVTSQALEQLKALFGAAPTEGERRILLDIQGSISQSAEAREAIWERAKQMAQARIAFQRQRAEGLRAGGYFRPGGGASVQLPSSPGDGAAPAPVDGNDPLGIRR